MSWFLQSKDYEEGSAARWGDVAEHPTKEAALAHMRGEARMRCRDEDIGCNCDKIHDLVVFRVREDVDRFDGMVNGEF